jgi:FKBP-type peptidyl-prolyl cis-trans isomerase
MNKVTFYFILSITTLLLSSCSKNNADIVVEPLRDYTEQRNTDMEKINEYLNNYYIEVNNAPGESTDQDVTIAKLDATHAVSIRNQTTYPLKNRIVNYNGIDYTVYYLELRQGTGISPTNVDGVLAGYKGTYLYSSTDASTSVTTLTATQFEENKFPQSYFSLLSVVNGWSEIFPKFKQGTYSTRADGTIKYENFGAGVMFLPSGLGYFANASGLIPSYSPLVFSFKLYDVQRLDRDVDGILDYLEDRNGDGYIYDYRNTIIYPTPPTTNIDDTDGDGIPDFIDIDDDGDGFTTKIEIKNAATGLPYPFADIPTCTSGKKNYLDANCHP